MTERVCDNCEDKANSYSMGFKDGYYAGGFEFEYLRRWLIMVLVEEAR